MNEDKKMKREDVEFLKTLKADLLAQDDNPELNDGGLW